MRIKCAKSEFTDYDFMRLFLATLASKKIVIFDRHNVCYTLYPFRNRDEYKDLFQDIAVKEQIEGNFLCLEDSIQNAVLGGLICCIGSERFIPLTTEEFTSIIESYDQSYSFKMSNMADEYLQSKVNEKQRPKRLFR